MSSNIANGRKSNYLILGKITLFVLILSFNFENQRSLHPHTRKIDIKIFLRKIIA